MTTTHYTLEVNGELEDFVRSTKAVVVAEAEKVHKATRAAVRVLTGTGFVAFELKASKARVVTFHTKAFTKTIVLPANVAALVPDGYVAAYERPTNGEGAVVLRNEDADEESRYAVMNRTTGELVAYTQTTRDAGYVMKGMKAAVA